MSGAEGCWDAWFDGLADAIRHAPVIQPERVRAVGERDSVVEPIAAPSVAGAAWCGSGELFDDERPE